MLKERKGGTIMSDEIIKLLEVLEQEYGADYAKDIMERYVEYFGISAAIWLSVLILMVIGTLIAIPKLFKYMEEYNIKCCASGCASECIIWPGALAGFLMGVIVLCLFGIALAITSLIQYYTVPENIIIEHFKFLIET